MTAAVIEVNVVISSVGLAFTICLGNDVNLRYDAFWELRAFFHPKRPVTLPDVHSLPFTF